MKRLANNLTKAAEKLNEDISKLTDNRFISFTKQVGYSLEIFIQIKTYPSYDSKTLQQLKIDIQNTQDYINNFDYNGVKAYIKKGDI